MTRESKDFSERRKKPEWDMLLNVITNQITEEPVQLYNENSSKVSWLHGEIQCMPDLITVMTSNTAGRITALIQGHQVYKKLANEGGIIRMDASPTHCADVTNTKHLIKQRTRKLTLRDNDHIYTLREHCLWNSMEIPPLFPCKRLEVCFHTKYGKPGTTIWNTGMI